VDDTDAASSLAHARVGDSYYQEFAPGVAEDQARVQSIDASHASSRARSAWMISC
jgi:hypothetical protein